MASLAPFTAAHALQFNLNYGNGIEGTLNTSITAGVAMRMQGRASDLVSKSNLNPNVCGGVRQSCQGVYRDQFYPAAALAAAAGQATNNADDGNWNYDKYHLTQGPIKLTQDLKLTYGDFGLFSRWLYYYDFVNNDFTEYHPDRITRANMHQVSNHGQGGNCGQPGSDRDTCNPNSAFSEVYGSGGVVRNKRNDGEILSQIGTDFQLLDAYLYGQIPLPAEHKLTFKVGRLSVNWGQSTVLVFNSINQANPLQLNNFLRVGNVLSSAEEVFVPTGMVFLSTEPFTNTTLEGFYGWEWKPVEIPAPGSFMSFLDIGTNNAVMNAGINFGGGAEDPERVATPQANPLSGLTNTTITLERLPDNEPKGTGQYGLSFRYYADWLNNGTDLGLFFMNYHSKLPYASFYSSDESCARKGGRHGNLGGSGPEGQDIDAYDGPSLLLACPDLPVLHPDTNGQGATSNAVPIDTVKLRLEYPENIKMYGISFATTLGDYSVQGEVAYRPKLPMQVDPEDLVFAGLQPMLSRCHDPNLERSPLSAVDLNQVTTVLGQLLQRLGLPLGVPNPTPAGRGCAGSTTGLGTDQNNNTITYAPSDFNAAPGVNPYKDTFDLIIGHADGSARSFPSFVAAYRGYAPGEVPANTYLRGWEEFKSFQFNLGLTKVIGATDNWIGADQVIMLYEFGANWSPNIPAMDVLQIEGPGTYYHASAGADGSGANGSRQACAATVDCNVGPDGLRFNPHQQDTSGYADRFSWGYRVVSIVRYESVLPGISLAPFFLWWHDVHGTEPDPSNQFLDGRKIIQSNLEVRYKEALSFTLGYTWFMGGGQYNLWRDRDNAQVFVKYQF